MLIPSIHVTCTALVSAQMLVIGLSLFPSYQNTQCHIHTKHGLVKDVPMSSHSIRPRCPMPKLFRTFLGDHGNAGGKRISTFVEIFPTLSYFMLPKYYIFIVELHCFYMSGTLHQTLQVNWF